MAIIGIDLGTTNSVACVSRDGSPQVIRDYSSGQDIVPSVIGIHPKTRQQIYGKTAKDLHPSEVLTEIKRKMGSTERIRFGDRELLPEEISALLLKHIKSYAEQFLNEEVTRAVITVPALFDDKQRTATKRAGELAGFCVERLISEPTAAALAYNVHNKDDNNIMVYDLGGGTFDVSILEIQANTLDVKASYGDPALGGKDFDELIFEYVRTAFLDLHGMDLSETSELKHRIVEKCEEAKKQLSFSEIAEVVYPAVGVRDGKILNLNVEITRATFEKMIAEKLRKTEDAINKALRYSQLSAEDIDTILLIGGSTRIPCVQIMVERTMGKKPLFKIDPDLAVAMGAAVQSSIIEGHTETIIMDKIPYSLGIEVLGDIGGQQVTGLYSEIIPEQAPMLKEYKEVYRTIYDSQKSVEVKVFQKNPLNDSIWAHDHSFLGSDTLEHIPDKPAGEEIEISLKYNLNGILDVVAQSESLNVKQVFSVKTDQYEEPSSETIESMWQESEKAQEVESTIRIAEKRLSELGEHEELKAKITALKDALIANNSDEISRLDDEINDLLFELD